MFFQCDSALVVAAQRVAMDALHTWFSLPLCSTVLLGTIPQVDEFKQ